MESIRAVELGDFAERGRKGWLLDVKLKPILCLAGRVEARPAKTKHLRPTRFILNHCYFTRQRKRRVLQLSSTCSCQERFCFMPKVCSGKSKQCASEKFDHAVWRFGSTSIFQGTFPPGPHKKHCQSSIFTQWGWWALHSNIGFALKKIWNCSLFTSSHCLAWHPFSFKFCEACSKIKPIKVVTLYTAKCTQPIDGGGSVSTKLIIQSNQIALANFWSHFAPARVSTKIAAFKSASSVWLSARVRISKFAGPRVCDSVQTQTTRWKCAIESKIIPAESCKCCGHLRTNARMPLHAAENAQWQNVCILCDCDHRVRRLTCLWRFWPNYAQRYCEICIYENSQKAMRLSILNELGSAQNLLILSTLGSENKAAVISDCTNGRKSGTKEYVQAGKSHCAVWSWKKWQTMGRNKSKEPYLPLLCWKSLFSRETSPSLCCYSNRRWFMADCSQESVCV